MITAETNPLPRRVENVQTDRGSLPVYATGTVEQPWDGYSDTDHAVWQQLYRRQREILPQQSEDGGPHLLRLAQLRRVLARKTGRAQLGGDGPRIHERDLERGQRPIRHCVSASPPTESREHREAHDAAAGRLDG